MKEERGHSTNHRTGRTKLVAAWTRQSRIGSREGCEVSEIRECQRVSEVDKRQAARLGR